MRTRRAAVAVSAFLLTLVLPGAAFAATTPADVVPVDPGPVAAGRPIVGTPQNLPPLLATHPYDAGDFFGDQIRDYYTSGQARRDQQAVSREALHWVRQWLQRSCDGTPRSCGATVVFDIDDTLLDNYGYYASLTPPFSFNPASYNAWASTCASPANAPVQRLYRSLEDRGVGLVLITGRAESLRQATSDCLRQRGISGWRRLVMRGADAPSLAADFKADVRAGLRADGMRIVASIGDQVSDMSHGSLKRGFLLPNAMYLIP
jgi:predicted secreted acid phosphatase